MFGNPTLSLLLRVHIFEHKAQLFQSAVVGLREDKVHCCNLDQNPDAVDDVVLPADGPKRNWINIRVEKDCESDRELLDGDTLRALLVWEDFYKVRVGEGVPSEVVKSGSSS